MKTIHDSETLRIYYEEGEGDNTLVSFSGVDFDVFGFTPKNRDIRPEFVRVTEGMGDRFWVIDKERTWGCHIDWEWVSNFLSPHFEGKRVVTLGNCMGATNAIKFAYHADVHLCIGFTPHWSVDPNEVTHEFDPRTKHLREKALSTGWKSLEGMFRPMTTYINVWTPDEVDVPHMIKFPKQPNNKPIFIVKSNHSVARMLRNAGVLTDFLDACIRTEDPSPVLDEAGILYELF